MYWIVIQWVIQSKVFKIKWVETFKIKWVRVFKIKWVRVRLFTHVVLFSVLYVLLFLLNIFLMYVVFAVVSVCGSCWSECGGCRVQYDIIGGVKYNMMMYCLRQESKKSINNVIDYDIHTVQYLYCMWKHIFEYLYSIWFQL